MTRREIREHIFKLLFEAEYCSEQELSDQINLYFEQLDTMSKDEGAFLSGNIPTKEEQNYITAKALAIQKAIPEIDITLNHLTKGWKTTRMNRVDLSILRLAVYEIEKDEEIPSGVAVNEAVELAKTFSSEESGAFVNGILSSAVRLKENKDA